MSGLRAWARNNLGRAQQHATCEEFLKVGLYEEFWATSVFAEDVNGQLGACSASLFLTECRFQAHAVEESVICRVL